MKTEGVSENWKEYEERGQRERKNTNWRTERYEKMRRAKEIGSWSEDGEKEKQKENVFIFTTGYIIYTGKYMLLTPGCGGRLRIDSRRLYRGHQHFLHQAGHREAKVRDIYFNLILLPDCNWSLSTHLVWFLKLGVKFPHPTDFSKCS